MAIDPSIPHTDIMLDSDSDLTISGGDFVVADSALQEAKLLLLYAPGTLRSAPVTGVGFKNYINTEIDPQTLKALDKAIQQNYSDDGKTANTIEYVTGDGDLLDVNIDFDQTQ